MQRALPPYARLIGIEIDRTDDALTYRLPFADPVLGRPGFLHGGAIAGLLEIAGVGTLIESLGDREPPVRLKPINMTVDFMRGGREATTFARAVVSRLGNRVANVDVVAWQDEEARPIARAHINFLLAVPATPD